MKRIHDTLFVLLRSALREEPSGGSALSSLTAQEWLAVYKLAARQGVLALAYDGLNALPAELRPPRDVLFGWAVNVEKIETRYDRQTKAARTLFRWCEERDLHPVLLKGIALSRLYPIPEHRPCGDIDIYLGQRAPVFDELMRRQGITVDASGNEKHSVFVYRSVMVENHRTFLDTSLYGIDRMLEEYLLAQEVFSEEQSLDGMRFRVLPPTADALFLLRHTARHLERGIGLRHVCDWMLFVHANGVRIDWSEFDRYVDELKLGTFYRILTGIATDCLGARFESPVRSPHEKALQEKVLRYILDYHAHAIRTRNPFGILRFKTARLIERRWVLRRVLHCSFAGHIWRSALTHLRNPGTIFDSKE